MNELQLLQQAYSNGTITPQQAERLKQLMAGQGASPAMSRMQSMFQQPTKSYYDSEQGKWVEQGAEANYFLPSTQVSPITQSSNLFQDLSIEDAINEEWKNNVTTGISDGTATEEQRMQYQDWIKGENDRLGYNKYDINFGSTTGKNLNGNGKSVDGSGALVDTTGEGEGMPKANMFRFPMINPGGSDLSTEIYSLGRALGSPKGTPGRGMNIVGAGGAAALDIARNLASGIGFSKRNQYVMDWYKKKQQERNYVPDSQSEDQNSTGGMKLGGTMNMFAEDGMTMPQEQMQPQQPQEQIPEGQEQQMQQVVQMIAGMLQQGANPQQVLEALVSQGIPQQQAEQMIQMVVQQMQGQQAPAVEQPQDQQMVMKNGGTFNKRIGESVTIKVGGKKVKGVIKEIKNGQITLK